MAINILGMSIFKKNKESVTIENITETDANDRPTANGIQTILPNQDMLIRTSPAQVEQNGELVSVIEFKGYMELNESVKRGHRVKRTSKNNEILEIIDIIPQPGHQQLIMNSKEY